MWVTLSQWVFVEMRSEGNARKHQGGGHLSNFLFFFVKDRWIGVLLNRVECLSPESLALKTWSLTRKRIPELIAFIFI